MEELIRDRLLTAFPSTGFRGDETGQRVTRDAFRWLVDPNDGSFGGGYAANLEGNPAFVNAAIGDFDIGAGSP